MNSKHIFSVLAAAALAVSAQAAEPQNGSGETNGYKLVWQDLFDSGVLNADRWNIEVNGDGGGNAELQYYTDSEANVHVGDDGEGNGCLILTARRQQFNNRAFTSGRVNTMKLFNFTHGKIEASIKLPQTANGLWPAFWMMGDDWSEVGWPKCGEIDILEMGHSNGIAAGTQNRLFNGACHWGQGWPNASYAKDSTKSYSLQDGKFHLFTLIWDENSVAMYVDLDVQPIQTPYYKMDIPCNNPDDEWSAGNYFHKPNFVIFDLAVGGNFTGIHDAAGITALNDGNAHEASMYVNYLKVYQKGGEGETLYAKVPGDSDQNTQLADVAVSNSQVAIRLNGRKISADGCYISVSDLSGRTVASGLGELNLDFLHAGVYVASAGTSTAKIILR